MLKIFVNSVTVVLLITGFTSLSNGKPFDDDDTVVIDAADYDGNVVGTEDSGIDISYLGSVAYGRPSNETGEFFSLSFG